jgi:hypothetical protein
VLRITGELADLAERTWLSAEAIIDNARRALRRVAGRTRGRLRRAINELATSVERAARIVAQTRRRLRGDKPDSATRLVSLHDPDARPIAKGRINRPGARNADDNRPSGETGCGQRDQSVTNAVWHSEGPASPARAPHSECVSRCQRPFGVAAARASGRSGQRHRRLGPPRYR